MDEGAETCMKLLPNLLLPAFLLDCLQVSHHLRFRRLVTFFSFFSFRSSPTLRGRGGLSSGRDRHVSYTMLLQPHSLSFLAPLLYVAEVV
jgi:hypothetical protein